MEYFKKENDRLVCLLCSYYCKLKEGQTGICGVNKNIGDKIGQEVKTLIDTAYNDALSLLNEHRDKLDLIANALLEKEKINEEDFKRFFN